MSAIKRAYHLTLEVGADTKDDLVAALDDLATRILLNELSGQGAWGSPSTDATYKLEVDPNMTRAKYFAALKRRRDLETYIAEAGKGGQ